MLLIQSQPVYTIACGYTNTSGLIHRQVADYTIRHMSNSQEQKKGNAGHGKPVKGVNVRDRHSMFLEYYNEGETAFNIKRSAIKAGFTENTADKQGKSILQTALKRAQERAVQTEDKGASTEAQRLLDNIGLTRADVYGEWRKIVEQDRDLGMKWKAMNPVLMADGVNFGETQSNVTVPVFQVSVSGDKSQRLNDSGPKIHDATPQKGTTEPYTN